MKDGKFSWTDLIEELVEVGEYLLDRALEPKSLTTEAPAGALLHAAWGRRLPGSR